jgi:hypothetical protein
VKKELRPVAYTEIPASQLGAVIRKNRSAKRFIIKDSIGGISSSRQDDMPAEIFLKEGLYRGAYVPLHAGDLDRVQYAGLKWRIEENKKYTFFLTVVGYDCHIEKIEGLLSIEESRQPYEITADNVRIHQNEEGTLDVLCNTFLGYTNIIIPEKINGIEVSKIGGLMERRLTSVTLPNTVKTIGGSAFAYNKLTGITIPEGVTTIGDRAFLGNQITEVVIPASVTNIGGRVFAENPLTSVTILGRPRYGTEKYSTFFHNNAITKITLENSDLNLAKSGFEQGFINYYNSQNKRAGTYVKNGQIWFIQE